RPGLAKAAPVPPELGEERAGGGVVVRAVLGDLGALIARHASSGASTFVWGTWERGGARLVPAPIAAEDESLMVSWKCNEIERIEIESRASSTFRGPESPVDAAALRDRLIPMLWAHIRGGGALPPGVDRFARLL
ncbi:MAG: hypothetical protein JRE81_14480, partial [Deltaproteobacteria bacterium]|nr:hypothetical protein [Deltaproteobacteria bacterium]